MRYLELGLNGNYHAKNVNRCYANYHGLDCNPFNGSGKYKQ